MFTRNTVVIAGIVGVIIVGFLVLFVVELKSKSVLIEKPYASSDIKISTYKGKGGWGYDIYVDGAILIHQPHIPALSGNHGFATKTDAQRVAQLVSNKVRKNIFPPSLTIKELKNIGVAIEE